MSGIKGINKGIINGMWKENVGYKGLHQWVRRNKSKQILCNMCGLYKKLEVANISGKYLRDLSDWQWLCRRCHMIKDNRLNKSRNKKGFKPNFNQLKALELGRKQRWLN